MGGTVIPDALDAESALLGAGLVRPAILEDVAHLLVPGDFHSPLNGTAWNAIVQAWRAGDPLDAVQLVLRVPEVDAGMAAGWVSAWGGGRPSRYVEAIIAARARRDLYFAASEVSLGSQDPNMDPFEARDRALAAFAAIDTPQVAVDGLSTLGEFLARPQRIDEWVIPGLIGEGWRALVVAEEGKGKMWLLRQLAVAASAGVHPLYFSPARPVRSLMVDLENPELSVRQSTRRMMREAKRAGDWADERCWLWHEPGGIDIRTRRGRSMLDSVLRQSKPDLVCLGPLYKAYRQGKEGMEEAAAETQGVLDDLRTRHRFALVLEHHAPKAQGGIRDILPFGSSLWLRWPELGLKLLDPSQQDNDPPGSLRVRRFRPDRLPCAWPERIDRSSGWPWTGYYADGFAMAMDRLKDAC